MAVIWLSAFAASGSTVSAPPSLLTLNVSVRPPTPRVAVGENQTLRVQLPAAARAGAVQVKPLVAQVGAHVPWAAPVLIVNSLPAGMVKFSVPVPRPPVLLTVTTAAALVAVMAVSGNVEVPRVAWRTAPLADAPTRDATSLSVAPAMVALTVRVALSAVAVSLSGMSRRRARLTQVLPGIVAFDTWSSATAKSAAFGPVMANWAPVALVAALLHTVRVEAGPAVPLATAAKVSGDGSTERGPAALPLTVAASVDVPEVAVTVPVFVSALDWGVKDKTRVQYGTVLLGVGAVVVSPTHAATDVCAAVPGQVRSTAPVSWVKSGGVPKALVTERLPVTVPRT